MSQPIKPSAVRGQRTAAPEPAERNPSRAPRPLLPAIANVTIAALVMLPASLLAQEATGSTSAANAVPATDTASATGTTPPTAAAPAPTPSASALADLLAKIGLTETGYVAASYYHSSGDSTFHEFDTAHDTFQLDQAGITVAYQPKDGFGALVNLVAGEDARVINRAEDGTDGEFNVTQAFVQYAHGPLTVIGGRFLTLAGAESENPSLDTNFSRSLLYFAEPLTHTGIRATYAATDTITLTAGINNGWNTTSTSYGSKTGEFAVMYMPNKIVSLTAQAYVGKEASYNATRALLDIVATCNATDSLSFVLNYDWGQQQQQPVAGTALPSLDWDGIAGYVNYAFNSEWRISLRGEYLDDKGGFVTNTPQKIESGTVTAGYSPVRSFELRLEARYDTANKATFIYQTTDTETFDDHQTGFAVQGIYEF